MSCAGVGNIKIEPVNVTWEIEQQETFDFSGQTAAGLGGKYVLLWSALDAVAYYAWFDEANGDVDPAPAGKTEIEVNYSASAASTAIATAFASAVNAVTGFDAAVDSDDANVVIVTRTAVGDTTDAEDGDTTIAITVCQSGGSFDLGLLQGDVEFSYEETLLEVKAHQSGTQLLADLRQGTVNSVTLTMQETHAAALKEMFARSSGGVDTPSGGTEVFGVGTNRIGTNTISQARRLILHPTALESSDYSRSICFWKAYPQPESLVFSGENPQTLSVTFKTYKDDDKPEAINIWASGDYTQYLPE
jgi:hypothetical protein